jgi:hypothetical protein
MMNSEIFGPIVALAIWTMIMWLWMYATRLPAMGKVEGLDAKAMVGGIGADLDKVLPGKVQWIAHNYNHLHEAPTVFYAVSIVLALVGAGDGFNSNLAWIYVALRVAHSLVQALWNRVIVRFALFALSSIVLIMLTAHAAFAVF